LNHGSIKGYHYNIAALHQVVSERLSIMISERLTLFLSDGLRMFNTTFNTISVISRRSVLLPGETGVPRENH
jgi:hypothetical protein